MSYDNTHKIRIKDLVSAVSGMKTLANGLDDRITALEGSSGGSGGSVEISEIPGINCYHCAGTHNSIFRGKNLGSSFTNAQSAAIQAGTFEDLYIGDYWTGSGFSVNFRIAGFDYFFGAGGDTKASNVFTHHAVIVPDNIKDLSTGNNKMNSSNITTNAYVGSELYKNIDTLFGTGKVPWVIMNPIFGDHIILHKSYFQDTCANGVVSNGGFYDVKFEIMSEQMVYGRSILGQAPEIGKCEQLPLFRLAPEFIADIRMYWLRDVANGKSYTNYTGDSKKTTSPTTEFVAISTSSLPFSSAASNAREIRPAFAIQ